MGEFVAKEGGGIISQAGFLTGKELGEVLFGTVEEDGEAGHRAVEEEGEAVRGGGSGWGWRGIDDWVGCRGTATGDDFEDGLHAGDSLFDGIEVVHGFGGVVLEAGERLVDVG